MQATAQAMQNILKKDETKERFKKKLDLKQLQETQQKLVQQHAEDMRLNKILNDEQIIAMFNTSKSGNNSSTSTSTSNKKDKKDKKIKDKKE